MVFKYNNMVLKHHIVLKYDNLKKSKCEIFITVICSPSSYLLLYHAEIMCAKIPDNSPMSPIEGV